ncbi:MAG TPA: hypothetical protein VF834_25570 [Streptosporangiaceae bacterium]
MARLFIRLKLSLIAGGLRGAGGTARIVGLIVAIVGALWAMPLGFGLLALQHGRPDAVNVAVAVFTGVALGWLVLPMATFGADETLDPARLMLLPLRPVPLARGLLAAALTGIGPILTFVVLLGAVVALADGPGSALVGILAVLIELGLCVAGSRALITALSGLLRSRRGRDLGVLIGALLTLALFGTNMAFQHSLIRSGGHSPSGLGLAVTSAASVARWAPPGMAAHAIADAAAGRYGAAALGLGASAATVALLIGVWILALRRALERPDTSTAVRDRGRGRGKSAERAMAARPAPVGSGAADPRVADPRVADLGVADRRMADPQATGQRATGQRATYLRLAGLLARGRASRAVNAAGRELRYYLRDPRRKQQLVSLAMPVFLILANSRLTLSGPGTGTVAGNAVGTAVRAGAGSAAVPGLPVWPAVLGGAIAGTFSSANQFGIDGPALWMNVVATARWQDLRADIAGKNLAGAVITVPVFAALYAAIGAITGNGASAAVAFAMAICALGATSAVSTVISVLLPVPVPERRSSAFGGGGVGQGCLASLTTFAGLGVAVAAMIPVFVLHSVVGAWLLVIAPCYGAALAWAGRRAAAVLGFRRLPEVLAIVARTV